MGGSVGGTVGGDLDVVVIGGGPAGLATAIAAAQHGLRVTVAEACAGPLDKCCGEGLLPPAVAALGQLGIARDRLARAGSPIRGVAFLLGAAQAFAAFRPGQAAIGVRRTVLHGLLLERAREAGVRILPGKGELRQRGREAAAVIAGREYPARWIVGADGAQSAVRAAAGLDPGRLVSRRFAVRQHFLLRAGAQTPDRVEVHWGERAQAYVTPTGAGQIGIAVVSSEKFASMGAALRLFPALNALLAGATAASKPRGAVTSHRTLGAVQHENVALVGDASGGVDAITGDGLSLAFEQSLALPLAFLRGDLREYQAAHERLLRPARVLSRTLLAMAAHPALARASLLALRTVPGVFPSLLRFHTAAPFHAEEDRWLPVPTSTSSA